MSGQASDRAEEAGLMARCRAGDDAAFAAWMGLHKKAVYLLAWRLTGLAEDAEDVAQETFVRAFRNMHRLDPERGGRLWLLRVATNLSLNRRRALARRWRAHRQMAEEAPKHHDPRGVEAAKNDVREALGRLPAKLRAAVALVAMEGLTHREAGEVLGCREGTVSWRVFQAREQLREFLGDGGEARRGQS